MRETLYHPIVLRRLVLAVACVFVAPSAGAQTQSEIAAAYGGVVPVVCTGARVDLTRLSECKCTLSRPTIVRNGQTMMSARSTCGDAIEKLSIASLVDLRVTAAPAVIHGGAPMTVVVSITNHSNKTVPVVLDEQAPWLMNDLSIVDASGKDVAREAQCGEGFSASGSNYMVVLPPNGFAEWRLPWNAATEVVDKSCTHSKRALPIGTYTLDVPLQLEQIPNAIAHGTLRVQ